MRKKSISWKSLPLWGKKCAAIIPIFIVLGFLSPYALAMLTWLPLAGKWTETTVIVLAERTERQINSGQITRQVDIDRLKSRCAIRCDQFDRKALENLLKDWQDEQKELDKLRQKK